MLAVRRTRQDFDPLDAVLRPPPGETEEQRAFRLANELRAKQVSQDIDAQLKAEQARRKKRVVKLLLLGQSESGKSTTLRQFQRLYTPTAFREERILWRAVIQVNIVRSIRTILDALAAHSRPSQNGTSHSLSPNYSASAYASPAFSYPPPHSFNANGIDIDPSADYDSPPSPVSPSSPTYELNPHLENLKARLSPLRHLESLLIAKLVPPNEDEATSLTPASNWRNQEVFVRSITGWKSALAKARLMNAHAYAENGRPLSAGTTGLETADEPQEVLHSCKREMQQLWEDSYVREVLRKRKIRLEEFPGFFLNDLERVTSLRYMPTDNDVLKARLKTIGVSEHKFEMEIAAGRDTGTEWRIVDVGGSRSQELTHLYLFCSFCAPALFARATHHAATWAPFFDDVDAIIFLAPISGFDQVLTEDRTVNRLEDSVLLWKSVCQNKLLADVDLVLFLNKCDILEAKLRSGIRLAKYVKSYGDRENDLETVTKYLKGKFSAIHREYSPHPRKFYVFATSVTDTSTTAGIIASVRDMVVRRHLSQSKLL